MLVDVDQQGNLTQGLGIEDYQRFMTDYFRNMKMALAPVKIREGLDLLPCDISLSAIPLYLSGQLSREMYLKDILKPAQRYYDFAIIDCPPALDIIIQNALTASDFCIIPVAPSAYSYNGLVTMTQIVDTIKEKINNKLRIAGILITQYEKGSVCSKAIDDKLVDVMDGCNVFVTRIRKRSVYSRALEVSKAIFELKNKEYAEIDCINFTEELLKIIDDGETR